MIKGREDSVAPGPTSSSRLAKSCGGDLPTRIISRTAVRPSTEMAGLLGR